MHTIFLYKKIEFLTMVFFFGKQDPSKVTFYKNMGQEELWLDCAEKLTAMIQNIIEFAKLIPGFMRLSQDDQVSNNWQYNMHITAEKYQSPLNIFNKQSNSTRSFC